MNRETEIIMRMYNKIPKTEKILLIEKATGKNPSFREIQDFIVNRNNDPMRNGIVLIGYWENEKELSGQTNECISFIYSILPKKYRTYEYPPHNKE